MYQFSRAIYRELAVLIDPQAGRAGQEALLRSSEQCIERLATDREHFARPVRSLFDDVRRYFPMRAQPRACQVVTAYVQAADIWLTAQRRQGHDPAGGKPLPCPATTRRGSPCQREPLPHNGYCPSHQHLAETAHREAIAA